MSFSPVSLLFLLRGCEICEFRSRELVGFAVMDWHSRELILCQYGDNQTYGRSAMWVKKFMPKVVIVPEKMGQSNSRTARADCPQLHSTHIALLLCACVS